MVSIPSLIPQGYLTRECNNVAGEQYLGLDIMGKLCDALNPVSDVGLNLDNTPTRNIP